MGFTKLRCYLSNVLVKVYSVILKNGLIYSPLGENLIGTINLPFNLKNNQLSNFS